MRRAAPTLPVTPAMLRHFAVVTVVATVCLAVFANGENTASQAGTPHAAQAEGGGGMSAMFGGAEEAALKKARAGDGKRSVNGMHVASGTRLDQGGGNYEPEEFRAQSESVGDIRNLNPEYRNMVVGSPAAVAEPRSQVAAGPAPIKRDRSGIPIPPQRAGQPGNASAGPPRAPSINDIERMMETSRARGAAGNASAGGDDTDSGVGAED